MYAFFVEMIGVLDCETRAESTFNSELQFVTQYINKYSNVPIVRLIIFFFNGDMFVYSLNQSPLDLHIKLNARNNLSWLWGVLV